MRRGRWLRQLAVTTGIALAQIGTVVGPVEGSEVRFFTMSRRGAFLEGDLDGVSVDSLGVLGLANRVARVGSVEEPYLFTAARHPDGWVLGTGNAGRVVLLDESGGVTTLLEADEPTIFAVAVDGEVVWAASSPGGRVHRIDGGGAEVFYETRETYVWALAPDGTGGLWIATGTDGRVHRVDASGRGSVVYDVDDVHVRSLLPLDGGRLLMGTAGEGLLLLLEADGSARTLYDSALAEIVALERGAGGLCFAAAIQSEAGLVDMTAQAQAQAQVQAQARGQTQAASGEQAASATVVESGAQTARAASSGDGFRSQVLRFPCGGGVIETLWSFDEATVYDLLWSGDRLWIATGQEGKVFTLQDGNVVLEEDVDERQVVALLSDRHGPALATTNAAAVYRVLAESESRGVYTSAALDAGEIAEFGTLHWRGRAPREEAVRFSVRSGMSATPDRTWSSWSEPRTGREAPVEVPPGRYLQFRLELARADPPPTVSEVSISYRQKNLAPKIRNLEVLDAGQVLVPANFNPAAQVFEPVRPNRDGIFTTLTPERERDNSRLKTLWKRGYRTFRWTGEDPNEDQLSYTLEFRPESETERWFPIVEEHTETYFSFDATVLPDGVYRFRVTASDAAANGDGEPLRASRVTGPVTIDHTPPVLGKVDRQSGRIRFEVRDALNPLRQAEYSLDGGEWLDLVPADGLLDGRSERFELAVGAEVGLVLFRAMDTSFNLATFDLSPAP